VERLPHRYETDEDYRQCSPVHVVWELTLACNLKCKHCGSRAGQRRRNELTTAECLEVVEQLARLGTREISLIGGEAYLRADWLEIVHAITAHGMHASMQTGGRALAADKIKLAADAGLKSCGVSLDGMADLHDRLRGVKGSFEQALSALRQLRRHGIATGVNTQITALTAPDLKPLLQIIAETGVGNWQIQLTVAMGNAADHPELLLQPFQLLEIMPLLAELYDLALDEGILIQAANNIGYFGPYEYRWRTAEESHHWHGCVAGQTGLGIEADGTIKGCPSLATLEYSGGNVRHMTIADIIRDSPQLRVIRERTVDDLWGFCRTCYYSDVCRGGCTWTSHSLLGRAGNNPYCHYRVLKLAERGLRERVEQVETAPGLPFDHGRFNLILEPLDGGPGERKIVAPPASLSRIRGPSNQIERPVPQKLSICRRCDQYVFAKEVVCPHCGSHIEKVNAEFERDTAAVRHAIDLLSLELDQRSRT
jgi:Y-X(10)_GDL-associated radical SAM protein